MENEIIENDLYPDYVVPQVNPPMEYPYFVAAYYAPGQWWKVFPDCYSTREAAVKKINGLPRGWICGRIYKLNVEAK